jgi:uncharacterized protein YkwD
VQLSKSPVVLAVVLATIAALAAPQIGLAAGTASQPDRQLQLQLVRDINRFREAHGLPALHLSAALLAAARQHSGEMASAGYFSHDSYDGSPFWKRLQLSCPRGHKWLTAGENIYWRTDDATADGVTEAWAASPDHRANMLSQAWRDIGVSVVRADAAPGAYGGANVVIVTADFGG